MGGRYPSAQELSRLYHGLQELGAGETPVPLADIVSAVAPVAKTKVRVAISHLKEAGVVRESPGSKIALVETGITEQRLAELADEWKRRADSDREKLERMESYARTALCRWQVLRRYFKDEKEEERCGVCDNCRRGLAEQAVQPVSTLQEDGQPNSGPPTDSDLHVGDRVTLPRYGEGRIQALDGDALLVGFPDGRSRKFKREFARPVSRSA